MKSVTAKPRITITAQDHEKLSNLARAAMNSMPDVAATLSGELDRARVVADGRDPGEVVCMGSTVTFRDDTTGREQTVTLVYPDQSDIAKGRISVLTPIGTALIGLAVGQSIDWETRTGETKQLTVLAVHPPAHG
jgi:regulator of nucleoside diphosphate kinase